MNCRSTTASFTVSDEPRASLSCANLPTDSAFYDVSVRRLTALLQTSFRPRLATTPLSFASSYSILNKIYWDPTTEDLHLISSCPCRAYTIVSSRLWGSCVISEFWELHKCFLNSSLSAKKSHNRWNARYANKAKTIELYNNDQQD